jgi:hypothetical protein
LDGGDMGSRPTIGGSLVDPWTKELKTKDRPKAVFLLLIHLTSFGTAQDLASINPPDRIWQGFCKSISARYGDARPDRTQAAR